jgi:crossover junction endodeoxyribonuclease RuvC
VVAARRGLPVALHTPSEVKAAVTGSGRAGKEQVTTMVTRILTLAERPTPADAADALALAICHVWRGGVTSRLEEAAGSRANLEALAQAQSRLQVARLRAAVAAQEGRR